MGSTRLRAFVDELRSAGVVTAAAAVIGDARSIEAQAATGIKQRNRAGRVTPSSLFDLASLTKPVTASLALALDAQGLLELSESVGGALAGAGVAVGPGLSKKRLESLLRHRSGLQPWTPIFERCRRSAEADSLLSTHPELLGARAGTYSDLGYILWGRIAEHVTGRSLSSMVRELVVGPMRLRGLSGPPGDGSNVVECRLGNERERVLGRAQGFEIGVRRAPAVGTIQDGNARFLGGPCGHAGLFGSARAIWGLVAQWLGPGAALAAESVTKALAGRGRYVLGWRRRPAVAAKRAGLWYGHSGFTGGGVWFCPAIDEIRVLLTHRSSVEASLNEWQARFLELRL